MLNFWRHRSNSDKILSSKIAGTNFWRIKLFEKNIMTDSLKIKTNQFFAYFIFSLYYLQQCSLSPHFMSSSQYKKTQFKITGIASTKRFYSFTLYFIPFFVDLIFKLVKCDIFIGDSFAFLRWIQCLSINRVIFDIIILKVVRKFTILYFYVPKFLS